MALFSCRRASVAEASSDPRENGIASACAFLASSPARLSSWLCRTRKRCAASWRLFGRCQRSATCTAWGAPRWAASVYAEARSRATTSVPGCALSHTARVSASPSDRSSMGAPLKVDDQGAVAFAFAVSPVVHPDDMGRFPGWQAALPDTAQ